MKRTEHDTCMFCRHVGPVEGREGAFCRAHPPQLLPGPLVIREPKDLPENIRMDPTAILVESGATSIHQLFDFGFPKVEPTDWCGEWRNGGAG